MYFSHLNTVPADRSTRRQLKSCRWKARTMSDLDKGVMMIKKSATVHVCDCFHRGTLVPSLDERNLIPCLTFFAYVSCSVDMAFADYYCWIVISTHWSCTSPPRSQQTAIYWFLKVSWINRFLSSRVWRWLSSPHMRCLHRLDERLRGRDSNDADHWIISIQSLRSSVQIWTSFEKISLDTTITRHPPIFVDQY